MEKRAYGKTGEKLSVLGFGGMIVMNESATNAATYVARAVERGIDYFDVAPGYGNAEEVLASDKELWLFDSFQGLPAPTAEDELIHDVRRLGSMAAYAGAMESPRSFVEKTLAESDFPPERVHIVEGFFDDTTPLQKRLPTQCSFAFVDFDLYKPIVDALAYLHGVLAPGGCVAVHDYGHFSSGAQKAVDRFVEQHRDEYEFRLPYASAWGLAILKRKNA